MTKINLLPKDFIIKRETFEPTPLVLGGALILVLVCAGLFIRRQAQNNSLERRIQKVDAKLKELTDKSVKIDALEAEKSGIQTRLATLQNLSQIKHRVLYPIMFDHLLPLIPENLWFTSFGTLLKENKLELNWSCVAKDLPDIARFMENLENSKGVFTDVSLGGAISASGTDAEPRRQFSITCVYTLQEPK